MADDAPNSTQRNTFLSRLGPFGALVIVAAVAAMAGVVGPRPSKGEGYPDTVRLLIEATGNVRSAYWLRHRLGRLPAAIDTGAQEKGLDQLKQLAQTAPSARAWRMLAIAQYALGRDDWPAALQKLRTSPPLRPAYEVDRELALWNRVLGDAPVTQAECEATAQFVRSLNLGWYEHVALAALYAKCGDAAEAERHRAIALKPTDRLSVMLVVGGIVGLVGCILLFVATVMALTRRGAGRSVFDVPPLPEVAARVLVFAAAAYFGGLVVLRLCVVPLASPLTGRIHDTQTLITCEAVLNLIAGLLSLVPPVAVLVYMGRHIGLTAADIGLGRLRPLSHPLAGIAGYCAATPLLLISVIVSGILFEPSTSPMNPAAMQFALAQGVAPRVLLTFLGCIMAPFTEELVFRGIFLRALQPANGFLGAAVLTSLVFALLHPQLPAGFLSIFVLGLAFSLLYGMTRSLWPSMVAHAINNGLVFVYLSLYLGK